MQEVEEVTTVTIIGMSIAEEEVAVDRVRFRSGAKRLPAVADVKTTIVIIVTIETAVITAPPSQTAAIVTSTTTVPTAPAAKNAPYLPAAPPLRLAYAVAKIVITVMIRLLKKNLKNISGT